MKTAIYFVDGTTQLVLTPDTDWERTALKALHDAGTKLTVFEGSFYECRGGWYRQQDRDDSTILRIDKKVLPEPVESDIHDETGG